MQDRKRQKEEATKGFVGIEEKPQPPTDPVDEGEPPAETPVKEEVKEEAGPQDTRMDTEESLDDAKPASAEEAAPKEEVLPTTEGDQPVKNDGTQEETKPSGGEDGNGAAAAETPGPDPPKPSFDLPEDLKVRLYSASWC